MSENLEIMEMPQWLVNLEDFDIHNILKDSAYYPACCIDGTALQNLNRLSYSFIYVDHWSQKDEILYALDIVDECNSDFTLRKRGIKDHKLIKHESISKNQLTPKGWNDRIAPDSEELRDLSASFVVPGDAWAEWFIFEHNNEVDANNNPYRFSLLYIRGEGNATYQALYLSNDESPKFFCLINPGWGTRSWTREGGLLSRTIKYQKERTNKDPQYFVTGSSDSYCEPCPWYDKVIYNNGSIQVLGLE